MSHPFDTPQTAHAFSFTAIEGEALPLADLAGRAVLVVNTASACGFTSQYEGLEELWQRFRERGLTVLGVPSNDFNQELGDETAILQFCRARFGVTFPLARKTQLTGSDAHPFYRWLGPQVGVLGRPRWNFYKYLIRPDGTLADWFTSITKPSDGKLARAVESVLPPQRSM